MQQRGNLFLTLCVFSATGGIEKVCKVAGKALHELHAENQGDPIKILSLYDESLHHNEKYFPADIFKGFGKNKISFLSTAVKEGLNSKVIILSHVNLLIIGITIKILAPKTKLVLLAHGIEVWKKFPKWKRIMLANCDLILPVSEFTKIKMQHLYGLAEKKFTILNNCLDPFLPLPLQNVKEEILLKRYGFAATDKVLLTLTRLSCRDRYKGYEQVILSVHKLKQTCPSIKYLLAGKYEEHEKLRLQKIIKDLDLQSDVILAGYLPDEELAAHYNLADMYIMPSQKEGFGIVFIEAMFYGKPVIAGNVDGSTDALKNGLFGLLVDPANQQQIDDAIVEVFTNKEKYLPKNEQVMEYFGYDVYKNNLRNIISATSKNKTGQKAMSYEL